MSQVPYAASQEGVALHLLDKVLALTAPKSKEEILSWYAECLMAVKSPSNRAR